MIKDFDKNKVEVMGYGLDGHYPISLKKVLLLHKYQFHVMR